MSADDPTSDPLRGPVRVMQIICMALILGVLIFLAVIVITKQQQAVRNPVPDVPTITYVAVLQFALCFALWLFLPPSLVRKAMARIAGGTWTPGPDVQAPPTTDEGKLLVVRQTTQIIAYALLEGTAFLAIIAYLLEERVLALAVTGFCLLLMAATFPTRDRINQWLDRQLDLLRDLRSGRGA